VVDRGFVIAAVAAAVWINTDSIKLMLLYSSIVERVTGLAAAIGSAVRASLILRETTAAAAANAQAAGNNNPTSCCVEVTSSLPSSLLLYVLPLAKTETLKSRTLLLLLQPLNSFFFQWDFNGHFPLHAGSNRILHGIRSFVSILQLSTRCSACRWKRGKRPIF